MLLICGQENHTDLTKHVDIDRYLSLLNTTKSVALTNKNDKHSKQTLPRLTKREIITKQKDFNIKCLVASIKLQ